MFGVYLLHDNNLVRPYLWHTLLQVDLNMLSPFFIIQALIISCSVFGICIIIDKSLSVLLTPTTNILEQKAEKIINKIL